MTICLKIRAITSFVRVKTLLQTRHNVLTTIRRLKQLQTIDAKLDMSLSLTELKNIYEEINSLNEKTIYSKSLTVNSTTERSIDETISGNFKRK